MKRYTVKFRPGAKQDLFDLYSYIADQAGLAVAGDYIDRIESACRSLSTLPARGNRRDDLYPGLRIVGFERRVTIAFLVKAHEVEVVRVLYGGRNFERAFSDDP